ATIAAATGRNNTTAMRIGRGEAMASLNPPAKIRTSMLVSRFRSSPEFAARSEANFGIEGHQPLYDSSAALNPKFAPGLRQRWANFGFAALDNRRDFVHCK